MSLKSVSTLLGLLMVLSAMLSVWPEERQCEREMLMEREVMTSGEFDGWHLMTIEERTEHYRKMCSFRNKQKMAAYRTRHQKMMQAWARQKQSLLSLDSD